MRVFILLGLVAACSAGRIPENNLEYGDLLEGDIMTNGERVACRFCTKWTSNTLYFEYDGSAGYTSGQIADVQAGIDDLVASVNSAAPGCLDIQPRSGQSNYIRIGKYGGCSSYLGMIGGMQTMSLESGCINAHGTIMHEFLHAIGMHHEHKRSDRDDWVTINEENIRPGTENNFDKLTPSEEDLLGVGYDYGSVMHYGRTAFSDNGEETITPTDPDADIGQRIELSQSDIQKARNWLGC